MEQANSVHEETKSSPESSHCAKEQVAFLNIYFARMWHDLHDSKFFIDFLTSCLYLTMLVRQAGFMQEDELLFLDPLPLHNVLFGKVFSFRPNEVRHVVKFHGYIAIKHIFIPARSIERKIEKIGFS